MSVKKEKFVASNSEATLRILAEKFNHSSHSECYQVLDEVLRYVNLLFIYSYFQLNLNCFLGL